MHSFFRFRSVLILFCFGVVTAGSAPAIARVSEVIQNQYRQNYENRVMFLKIPIYSTRQVVNIEGRTFQQAPATGTPLYRVGDQFRIERVDFDGDEIKFRMGAMNSEQKVEIIFKFPVDLQENFKGRDVFDNVLQSTFTEGLQYSDIEDAKISFLKGEFNRSIDRIAGASSLSREFVLGEVAPLIPAYRETEQQKEALENRVGSLSAQVEKLKGDRANLESKMKEIDGELSGTKRMNASISGKLSKSESQVAQLEAELQTETEKVRRFERDMAAIQSSLNIEADSKKDLLKNNAELAERIRALQTDLEAGQAANKLLKAEIEDYKSDIRKKNSTIKTLTSNKNSIGRQFVDMKEEKEKLDEFAMAVQTIDSRLVAEKEEEGYYSGKAGIYVKDVLLGYLDWSVPAYLSHGESKNGRATFTAESIDYVKVTPEERQLLKSLGEKLKIRLDLTSLSSSMEVSTEEESGLQELGERDQFTWNWRIQNSGSEDASFLLSAYLENRNDREIPLFREENFIEASNPIRLIRSYLQPIPIAVGAVLGFLLFGIVGIFRRPKSGKQKLPPQSKTPPKPYVGEKKL